MKQFKKAMAIFLALCLCVTGLYVTGIDSQAATKPKLSKTSVTMNISETAKLTVKNKPSGAKVTWKSANTSVAKVASNGVVYGVGDGNTKITCTVKKGLFTSYSLKCSVRVKKPTLSRGTINIREGETKSISLKNMPKNAHAIWISDSADIGLFGNGNTATVEAFVGSAGKKVTGTVSIFTMANKYYNGDLIEYSFTVVISDSLDEPEIETKPDDEKEEEEEDLSAVVVSVGTVSGFTVKNGTPISDIIAELDSKTVKLTVKTASGNTTRTAEIMWGNTPSPTYNASKKEKQTLKFTGKVLLPDGVTNPNNVNTKVSVNVIVAAKGDAVDDEEDTKDNAEYTLSYEAHVQNKGWLGAVKEGEYAGTQGESLRMEALKINLTDSKGKSAVQYRVHVASDGWTGWYNSGEVAGTIGQKKAIEAIEVKLTGTLASKYDVAYHVHVGHIGDLGWTKNGASAGSTGISLRTEGFYLKLMKKGTVTIGEVPFISDPRYRLTYNAHVQNVGWDKVVANAETAGRIVDKLRIEAYSVTLTDDNGAGSILFDSRSVGTDWYGEKSSGGESGTTGVKLPLETIRMHLTGYLGDVMDVYYRTYVDGIGWLGYAKNGADAGSIGDSRMILGIEIRLEPKDKPIDVGGDAFVDLTPAAAVATNNPEPDFNNSAYSYPINPLASDFWGNCTWYAWGRACEIKGVRFPWASDARRWASDAQHYGYTVDFNPTPNSIAVWKNTYRSGGHVAYVESVNGDNVVISECNIGNDLKYAGRKTLSRSQMMTRYAGDRKWQQELLGYIHF